MSGCSAATRAASRTSFGRETRASSNSPAERSTPLSSFSICEWKYWASCAALGVDCINPTASPITAWMKMFLSMTNPSLAEPVAAQAVVCRFE